MNATNGVSAPTNPYYLQALLAASPGAAAIPANGTAAATGTAGVTASLSGPGQLIGALQQLQTQEPAQFSQVVGQIATQVQAAAQQQGANGTGQFLTSLAGKLQNVATTGDLSALESHRGHHARHAESTYNSQGQPVAPTTTTGAQTESGDNVQQLFANIVQEVQQATKG